MVWCNFFFRLSQGILWFLIDFFIWFLFWFLHWLIGCSVACCLISTYLWIFQFSFCNLFHTIMVRKDVWYDFSLLKFIKTYFVVWHTIYLGECFVCTWEECVFCFGIEYSAYYLLSPSGLTYHLRLFPYWFSVWMIYTLM